MVIVIEYEVITGEHVESRDYMQRALTGAMTQIREGADRLDPNHVKVVGVHVGVEDFVDRVLALFAKDASAPNGAPSSPVETTDAPARPIPPEALNGLTGAAYTDVIRREADKADAAHWATLERETYYDAANETRDRLLAAYESVFDLRRQVEAQRTTIAERDATIERLWAQLNETTNVPAKHGATHRQTNALTPMCRIHPDHFMPCSRCLGYGCTACDRGVQAADDRRSL